MQWLAIVMEEYKSLRQESLAAIDRQQRILASGVGLAGVVLGLGANAEPGSTLAIVLLLVLAPMLAFLITVMWLGEVERMVRAGAYVSVIERRVSRAFPDPPLGWESFLRRGTPGGRRILWVYRAVFGILWTLAVAGAGIGTIGLGEHDAWIVAAAGAGDALVLVFLFAYYARSEMRMRMLGGKRWNPNAMSRLARLVGGPAVATRMPFGDAHRLEIPAGRGERTS